MAEYCTSDEVKKRATANGWSWIADRDRDGTLNTSETASVAYAIAWAGRKIDKSIAKRILPSDARAQSNDTLRDIAIDLAVYRLFTNGGDDPPTSIERAFDDAKEELTDILGGADVPGLTYQPPYNSLTPARVPRAYIPR